MALFPSILVFHKLLLCFYVWLLVFYTIAICIVISRWVSTCDSARSLWVYSAAPLDDHTFGTMTCYTTQLLSPNTELTSPCSILILSSARLGNKMYQFCKSLVWHGRNSNSLPSAQGSSALLIGSLHPVKLPLKRRIKCTHFCLKPSTYPDLNLHI